MYSSIMFIFNIYHARRHWRTCFCSRRVNLPSRIEDSLHILAPVAGVGHLVATAPLHHIVISFTRICARGLP